MDLLWGGARRFGSLHMASVSVGLALSLLTYHTEMQSPDVGLEGVSRLVQYVCRGVESSSDKKAVFSGWSLVPVRCCLHRITNADGR